MSASALIREYLPPYQPEARAFLGVEKSLTGRRWADRLDHIGSANALAMAQRHEIPDIVARVLAGRGVSPDDAPAFLSPTLKSLMPDPSSLTDMDAAANRIAAAAMSGEKVAIFGDYDVDGATSAALMARFLRHQGLDPTIYIPDRIFEGYGPNVEALKTLAAGGAKLLVTVDCGTTSIEALASAKGLGLDVVVIDHHQVGAALPAVEAIVNPNRQDDLSGLGYLCAAGVTFLTLVAINRRLRAAGWYGEGRPEPDLMQWLDLVAVGTICDVVPLRSLNRAFVAKGLIALAHRSNRGLAALADVARLGGPVAPWHLGFIIGPRINAGGRISDAGLGARLLTTDDAAECERIAGDLDRLNQERQVIETVMLEEAVAEAEAEIGGGEGPPVVVTANERWHPGVVGLIAARLKERFRRPAVAIAFLANGIGTGSGRSIPGVDLGSAVRRAVEGGILLKGGGHAMAAGLTVEKQKLGELRAYLADALGGAVATGRDSNGLLVDAALTARGASPELIDSIERGGPFGAGHPEPVFAFPSHRLAYIETTNNGHLRLTLGAADGATIRAIAFRAADSDLGRLLLAKRGNTLHFAGTLSVDQWQGRRQASLRIVDAAEPAM
jgi:single-stranded-DNA-specific exonuclease